jgi:hypothetical protein
MFFYSNNIYFKFNNINEYNNIYNIKNNIKLSLLKFLYSNQMYDFFSITIIFLKKLMMMIVMMVMIIICYFTLQIKSMVVF